MRRSDACIRFLNEDPWVRLRTFPRADAEQPPADAAAGQNLLGYRHYQDGVVNRFVEKSTENGMDVYRVFDALNDVRNVRMAHDLMELGCDSLCNKVAAKTEITAPEAGTVGAVLVSVGDAVAGGQALVEVA